MLVRLFAVLTRSGSARPVPTFYVLTAVTALCSSLSFAVNIVYMATTVGMSAFQLVLVGTVLEAACFVFEVPTGVVADLYSRKLSLIIGFVLVGLGFALQGAIASFWAVLIAQVVWGLGYTFTSGSTDAWLADEVGTDDLDAIFTGRQRVGLVAGFAGTVAAGGLALVDIRIPMVLSGVGMVALAVGLAVRMPEHFTPTPRAERETVAHMLATARDGVALARRNAVVGGLLAVAIVVGLSSEAFDRLWQLRIVTDLGLPTIAGADRPGTWFAGFALVGGLVALLASLLLGRRVSRWARTHPGWLLATLAGLSVAGAVVVALAGALWMALAALWLRSAVEALTQPAEAAWLNRQLPSGLRATALSMNGQANAIGQVVGGPPLGLLGNRTRPAVAMLASAALAAPAVVILAALDRAARRGGADGAVPTTPR